MITQTDTRRGSNGEPALPRRSASRSSLRSAVVLAAASVIAIGCEDATTPDLDASSEQLAFLEHDGSQRSGETIVRWSKNNFELLNTLDGGSPAGLQLVRELAIVHIAMHDAANAARSVYETYALQETDTAADPALAAAAAAHAALVALRPGKTARADAFLQADLDRVADPATRQRSLLLGAAAAEAIMALRADDGFFDVVPYTFDPAAPGVYQPVPPAGTSVIGTQLPFVTPFVLSTAD